MVDPDRWFDVPLYWHYVAVRSGTLQLLGDALRKAARSALHA